MNEKVNDCWWDCGRIFFIFRVFISCKDGHNKDRNGKDLTEAEEIKKRWQEYTELYKKGLSNLDNHDDVVTHLKSYILECEVKQAVGSILQMKLVEVMEFQLSYFIS